MSLTWDLTNHGSGDADLGKTNRVYWVRESFRQGLLKLPSENCDGQNSVLQDSWDALGLGPIRTLFLVGVLDAFVRTIEVRRSESTQAEMCISHISDVCKMFIFLNVLHSIPDSSLSHTASISIFLSHTPGLFFSNSLTFSSTAVPPGAPSIVAGHWTSFASVLIAVGEEAQGWWDDGNMSYWPGGGRYFHLPRWGEGAGKNDLNHWI